VEFSPEELVLAGERSVNRRKAFNSRLGLSGRTIGFAIDGWGTAVRRDEDESRRIILRGEERTVRVARWDARTSLQKRGKN